MKDTTAAPMRAPKMPTVKASLRSLRCCSRQGSRFMRGMSVEAPQGEAAGSEQRRRVALHGLRARLGRKLHLAERIAALGGDADTALHDLGHSGHVRAAAADEDAVRLLTSRTG